jgi:predicted nucleotide-binding protein
MDLLDDFILKYEMKGFEIISRRRLRFGLRIFLKKEIEGWTSGFEGIYIYYYDGSASLDSVRECMADFVKFYEDENFGEGDKGFFLASAIDEKVFSGLKKAKIEDSEIRNSLKPFVLSRTNKIGTIEPQRRTTNMKKQLFIVHGRDTAPAFELQRLLEKELKLDSVLLRDEPHSGRTIIEKLEDKSNVDYAFVILTPDDVGALKTEKLKDRARQNVVLELGMFAGKIGRDKVCILLKGNIELPSDMHGIGYHRFHESVEEVFLKIKKELVNAHILI